ncbi:MAG: YbaK/EbsC family protein [Alphaproteobacteria bacterium]|jgi:Cys-tRNA(Pro) deacylase|nr:YbaK/EbsC family protein [Alphaproteobacteria bacterium]
MSDKPVDPTRCVTEALDLHQVSYELRTFSQITHTAEDAATAIGCTAHQIVKSLLFKTKKTDKAVLVLTSGPNRVDEEKISAHLGQKTKKADAAFVKEATGFSIGGVSPVGHTRALPFILFHEDLLLHDLVWAAAGTHNTVFCIRPQDLVHITDAQVLEVKEG